MNAREVHIPMDARVNCTDGLGGHITHLLVDPGHHRLTHLVVKEKRSPFSERMVPVEQLKGFTRSGIQLSSTKGELARLEPFIQTDYVKVPTLENDALQFGYWPYSVLGPADMPTKTLYEKVEYRRIPCGELAVQRRARVEATDGPIGRVEELVVDPDDMSITHLELRSWRPWGSNSRMIPTTMVKRVAGNTVYLKLDKKAVEALPVVQTRFSAS